MNSLILDCSAGMKIYLLKDEEEFAIVDENKKKHTDELLLSLDKILNQANLDISEVENFCVCVGPGSFTGVRVAVSICKGLVVESKKNVCIASNFDSFSFGLNGNYIIVLNGFSEFVYTRKCVDGKIVDACENVNDFCKEFNEKYSNIPVFVENEKLQNKLKFFEIDCKIAKNNTISLFKYKIKEKMFIELNSIEPIYLRASQAEIERNKKLNGTSK